MKLLIVDNYDSFTYNLAQIVKLSGDCTFEIIKNEDIKLELVGEFDKILFTPGPGLPEDFPFMFKILDKYKESKSIFGVCLGHQAIARFFGGELANSSNVIHGISKNIFLQSYDYIFDSIPNSFKGGLYHSWYVSKENLPNCLNITSLSEDGIIMSLSHKYFDIRGVQFHPESIMTDHGKKIIKNWLQKAD